MPCYYPIDGWRSKHVNPNGKRSIVFTKAEAFVDMPIKVPCGKCIGCKLERSKQWAIRCVHEASLHQDNMFLTLTYSDEHLNEAASLNKKHFQDFMKRLRKYAHPTKIRYFHCGEYGKNDPSKPKHRQTYKASDLGRPHYHAIIFGYRFDDLELYKEKGGNKIYMSPACEKIWPFGYNTIGNVTFESAAYVARYITKKISGEMAKDHYTRVDPETGEIWELQEEYTTMSRRPGIGAEWFKKFKNDCYPKDFVTFKGKKLKPPKYYDGLLEEEDIEQFEFIKRQRSIKAKQNQEDNNLDRLRVKEKVKDAQNKKLIRELDYE